jgi:hypothetical protein
MTRPVTNAALVASIVSNPSVHFVDKQEKMNLSMDKMIQNKINFSKQQTGLARDVDDSRGYGKGKNQGD